MRLAHHFDFSTNISYPALIIEVLPYFLVLKLGFLWFFRVYRITWRYVGLYDMIHIVTALFVAGYVLIILSLPNLPIPDLAIANFPKRVIFADIVISLFLISGLRISKRLYTEVFREKGMSKRGKRTLIIGAGNAGEMILRDMARQVFGGQVLMVSLLSNHSVLPGDEDFDCHINRNDVIISHYES